MKIHPKDEKKRFQITHFTYYQMEMIDTVEGGKITIFAQYLLENNETPFRVILDPPIGNMNQVIATEFNSIVNKNFIALPEQFQ